MVGIYMYFQSNGAQDSKAGLDQTVFLILDNAQKMHTSENRYNMGARGKQMLRKTEKGTW